MRRIVTVATLAVAWTQVGFAGNIDARALYNNTCASCHGQKAEKQALGRSEVIANNGYDDVMKELKKFKSGRGDKIMQAQVAKFSVAELDAIAHYVSTLKDPNTPANAEGNEDEKGEKGDRN